MIAHGLRHARSLDGTAGWFGSIGFRQPRLQAQLSAVVEVGAGTALAAGIAAPLAASAVIGTMGVAFHSVHRPNGFFITAEGWQRAALAAGLGIGGAAAQLATFWRRPQPAPVEEPEPEPAPE